ncbi:MAG: amidophosphoribosyltransferase, partial [Geodermatophilaceae bacterium]|nr:amidophosphoribosyltransferase [Geodermatophilaceae bacterium]
VSLDNVIAASEQPKNRLCRACYDGVYPISIPPEQLAGKHVLESIGRRGGASPTEVGNPSVDAELALGPG